MPSLQQALMSKTQPEEQNGHYFQKAMQLLTGQITLTKQAKNGFEMLGFTFVQVLPPVTTKKVEPTTSQFNS